ncbi:MAG: hypothetical protein JW774_04220 [Candidatus Aureabacteria bacterium]|nr:hypothetical protein [Candidatus Auribacterota bacterium]
MKLGPNVIISKDKLLKYLLVPRREDDKSEFLKSRGYTLANWMQLEKDMRIAAEIYEAKETKVTPYGKVYEVKAKWRTPNTKEISVVMVWIKEETGGIKFITLYPEKEKR